VEAFDLLARNPSIGHTRKDLTNQETPILAGREAGEDIEIASVTQGSRDIPSYLRKRS
jgi:plasmid stabilization system protein ParE